MGQLSTSEKSRRERWAERTGLPKSQFKNSQEGKAIGVVEKYSKEKEATVKKKAKIDTTRLQEDFARVMELAGVKRDRTLEDYQRNMKNLANNRAADIEDLNYYTQTASGRTQEDEDVALTKEAQRYELEQFKNQQSLASRNLVYGELGGVRAREEGLLMQEHGNQVGDINREANRSFQDIARNEYEKNRDVEMKYESDTTEAGVSKTRGIENINWDEQTSKITNVRNVADVAWNKKQDVLDINYDRRGASSTIEGTFIDRQREAERYGEKFNYFG